MKMNLKGLQKLNLSSIGELDRNKIILIVILCLFVIYLDFSFIIKTQLRSIQNIGPRIIKLQKDISSLSNEMASLKDLKPDQIASKKQEELAKSKKIILEEEIPLLLQEISDVAHRFNVKLMQIKPIKDPKAREEVVAGMKLIPITITLDLSGGYHAFGGFIGAIENSRRFMIIQNMRIANTSEDYLSHSINLVFKTLVKK